MARIVKPANRPLGVILHRGVSPFPDQHGAHHPYVVVALLSRSSNKKTGKMVQTYIIVDSAQKPTEALKSGADAAVCFDCPLRGILGKMRACYVNLGQGPRAVHDALRRGRYVPYSADAHDRFFVGRRIRWGAYGEPVLIPLPIVSHLSGVSDGWTGYTHQWRRPEFAGFRAFYMASVHSPADGAEANSRGWRYFRATNGGEPAPGEVVCPASAEAGYRRSCQTCNACGGAGDRPIGAPLGRSIVIATHGGFGTMHSALHVPALLPSGR